MSTKLGDITLTKQTGTKVTLNTQHKYVEDNKYFLIDVQSGAGAVTIASTDASIQSDSSSRNISGVIGSKSTSAPASGYYFKVEASGSGSSTITTAGWLNTGSLGTASASQNLYFPVQAALASISGTNTVSPSASVSGSNITLSNTNNGISVTAVGGGTASASASAVCSQAGYAPSGENIGTGTIDAASQTTSVSSYISGVTLVAPESGTNSFSITVPNGDTTVTFTFVVDSNGNTHIG